ncbi:hypothetical protein QQZ08_012135 [Neonectria magnoliae]|uniref:Uncharacterized protein n=1 Tax=Neonectria magnoliae TaxID=2732573 RepID=A0ABR1H4N3_9HYPO
MVDPTIKDSPAGFDSLEGLCSTVGIPFRAVRQLIGVDETPSVESVGAKDATVEWGLVENDLDVVTTFAPHRISAQKEELPN